MISTPAIADELLAPLGKMTAYFAMLESQVSSAIGLLIHGNSIAEQRIGQIVTADLSFKQLVNLFHALALHRFSAEPKVVEAAGKLRTRLVEAGEQRNILTHSIWGAASKRGHATRIKSRLKKGELKFTFDDYSADDISKIALGFGALTSDLMEFLFVEVLRLEAEVDEGAPRLEDEGISPA